MVLAQVLGKFVVGMFIGMFVGITYVATHQSEHVARSAAAMLCRACIYLEALVAISLLFTLQYFGRCMAVKRTAEACFPLPDELLRRTQAALSVEGGAETTVTSALQRAAGGMANVSDSVRGVYCTRCFVWRAEDGHHCTLALARPAARRFTRLRHLLGAAPSQALPRVCQARSANGASTTLTTTAACSAAACMDAGAWATCGCSSR